MRIIKNRSMTTAMSTNLSVLMSTQDQLMPATTGVISIQQEVWRRNQRMTQRGLRLTRNPGWSSMIALSKITNLKILTRNAMVINSQVNHNRLDGAVVNMVSPATCSSTSAV